MWRVTVAIQQDHQKNCEWQHEQVPCQEVQEPGDWTANGNMNRTRAGTAEPPSCSPVQHVTPFLDEEDFTIDKVADLKRSRVTAACPA